MAVAQPCTRANADFRVVSSRERARHDDDDRLSRAIYEDVRRSKHKSLRWYASARGIDEFGNDREVEERRRWIEEPDQRTRPEHLRMSLALEGARVKVGPSRGKDRLPCEISEID